MSHLYRELLVATPLLSSLLIVGVDYYRRYRLYKHCWSQQEVCEKMEFWYSRLGDGWSASLYNSKYVPQRLDNPLYGEITFKGMESLVRYIRFNKSDVFYDLGSGVGKLVAYVYLTAPVKKSVGIEMVDGRNQIAMKIWNRLQAEGLLGANRELQFLHANLREVSFEDATVIYMSSLCFSKELMEELSQRFLDLKPGLRIISSQPLSEHPRLQLLKKDSLAMTWTHNSMTYYYKLLSA